MTNRCDVFVPGLLTPIRLADSGHPAQQVLPGLRRLLRGASVEASGSCAVVLAQKLKMPNLAYAAWTAAHYEYPVNKQWFLIDPVQVRTEHNAIYLTGNRELRLDKDQAGRFCDELSALEHDERWQFFPVTTNRWLMFADTIAELKTMPVWDALGRDLRDTWPSGADARKIQRHLTEWQMWLHTHPINQQFASQQQAMIQALWLWGNAPSVTPSAFPWSLVYTDSDWCKGLAKLRGVNCYELDRLLGTGLTENTLVWIDELLMPFAHGAGQDWHAAYEKWFTSVLEPLLTHATEMFDELVLHADNQRSYVIKQKNRWKFWRGAPELRIETTLESSYE